MGARCLESGRAPTRDAIAPTEVLICNFCHFHGLKFTDSRIPDPHGAFSEKEMEERILKKTPGSLFAELGF